MYVQLNEHGEYLTKHSSQSLVAWDDNNFCTPEALTQDGKAEQFRVYPLQPTNMPTHDPIVQSVRETTPVLTDKGHYEQAWEVVALEPEQVEANQLAKDTADAKLINDKIEALWSATDRYTSGYISGVAIGILTIGVMQQKPKALAVTGWSSAIWAEYYARKALVTATSTDDHDFTGFGTIPFSVPELQAEIGL